MCGLALQNAAVRNSWHWEWLEIDGHCAPRIHVALAWALGSSRAGDVYNSTTMEMEAAALGALLGDEGRDPAIRPLLQESIETVRRWLAESVPEDDLVELCDRLLLAALRPRAAPGSQLAALLELYEDALLAPRAAREPLLRALHDAANHDLLGGLCWELSDEQEAQLRRDVEEWRQRHPDRVQLLDRTSTAWQVRHRDLEPFLALCAEAGPDAIAREVIPWLLHAEDPLRARAVARARERA